MGLDPSGVAGILQTGAVYINEQFNFIGGVANGEELGAWLRSKATGRTVHKVMVPEAE